MVKRVWRDGRFWAGAYPALEHVRVTSQLCRRLWSSGFTLVVNGANYHWERVRELAEALMIDLGHPINVNLYFTPPDSQGFEAHFDWMDSIVLQVRGKKTWKLGGYVNQTLRLPYASQKIAIEEPETQRIIELTAGDVLYLPSGIVHQAATNGNEDSLHLTFGIEIMPRYSVMGIVLKQIQEHMQEYQRLSTNRGLFPFSEWISLKTIEAMVHFEAHSCRKSFHSQSKVTILQMIQDCWSSCDFQALTFTHISGSIVVHIDDSLMSYFPVLVSLNMQEEDAFKRRLFLIEIEAAISLIGKILRAA